MHQKNHNPSHHKPLPKARLAILSLILLVCAVPSRLQAQLPAGTIDASSSSSVQPADPLLAQANEALAKHDFPAALKLLTSLAETHPKDPQILYDLASTQDALAETPAQNTTAEATYRRAIAADPTILEPHLALGLLLARSGKLPDAHTELAAAAGISTGDPTLAPAPTAPSPVSTSARTPPPPAPTSSTPSNSPLRPPTTSYSPPSSPRPPATSPPPKPPTIAF